MQYVILEKVKKNSGFHSPLQENENRNSDLIISVVMLNLFQHLTQNLQIPKQVRNDLHLRSERLYPISLVIAMAAMVPSAIAVVI